MLGVCDVDGVLLVCAAAGAALLFWEGAEGLLGVCDVDGVLLVCAGAAGMLAGLELCPIMKTDNAMTATQNQTRRVTPRVETHLGSEIDTITDPRLP